MVRGQRNRHIDRLRGWAIMVVLLLHFGMYVPATWPWPGGDLWMLIVRNGYYGVTMFFVVSGFLISRNAIIRYGALSRVDVFDFYVVRAARIIPGLLLVILVATGLTCAGYLTYNLPANINLESSIFNLLIFRYDWYAVRHPVLPAWSPLWSLSIEGVSYVLLPLICLLCRRDWLIPLPMLAAVIIAPYQRTDYAYISLWSGCADAMAIGCLVALGTSSAWFARIPAWGGPWLRAIGLIAIVSVYGAFQMVDNNVFGPTLMAVAAAIFITGSMVADKAPRRWPPVVDWPSRLVEAFGRQSYELYLFHLAALLLLREWLEAERRTEPLSAFTLPAYFLCMLAMSSLIAVYYTNPLDRVIKSTLRRWRRIIGGGRSRVIEPSPALSAAPHN